ncbi:hypothetical protein [Thermicanus aegyptius]|uniref:hypothetical protein n=1 Tax=Thermicanus aegyptius TaxID=94009 RepID=UPI00048F3954|nr:hypothetical protein [Thermicanus aegyptius]
MKKILSKITAFFLLVVLVYVIAFSTYTFGILGPLVFFGVLEAINKIRGGRLNRYFTYVVTKDGIELQHNPIFIFYYADKGKVLRFTKEAIEKLSRKYPDKKVFAYTVTLTVLAKRKTVDVEMGEWKIDFRGLTSSYFLILTNINNWKKFRFARFFKKIDYGTPKKIALRMP